MWLKGHSNRWRAFLNAVKLQRVLVICKPHVLAKLFANKIRLGSILWAQFFVIFANFRQKFGVFLKNQCYDQVFAEASSILSKHIF
jgi:hypothetical protein